MNGNVDSLQTMGKTSYLSTKKTVKYDNESVSACVSPVHLNESMVPMGNHFPIKR